MPLYIIFLLESWTGSDICPDIHHEEKISDPDFVLEVNYA